MQNIVGLDNGLAPQRQAITQRNRVIYTFSGYKYTLISEWIRLFGLLRILDNLIAGAVCYFCTTISAFYEIYTLRMRVVANADIVWVGWFFMPSSGVGHGNGPHQWCRNPGDWKFWEGLGRRLGKFGALLVVCIDRLDVVTCGVTRWLGRGCRAAWLGVGCSGQPVYAVNWCVSRWNGRDTMDVIFFSYHVRAD